MSSCRRENAQRVEVSVSFGAWQN